MTRKKQRPRLSNFFGQDAKDYASTRWMERLQRETSRRALDLLQDERLGGPLELSQHACSPLLDVGCGNGYSTSEIFKAGFKRVIGLDISFDMIHEKERDFNAIVADMRHMPFRPSHFKYIISISAMNFIAENAIDTAIIEQVYTAFVQELKLILQKGGARGILEFYPRNEMELQGIKHAFGYDASAFNSFLVIDKPGTRKEQHYIIFSW